jgi:hypothetical protein
MEAVRHCSLGQISEAFFEVGGQYLHLLEIRVQAIQL